MKSHLTFVLSILLFAVACEEADFSRVCDVNDPASELEWLKDEIENRDDVFQHEVSYFSFIFEENMYIHDAYCGKSLILWASTYFNCKGKEVSFTSEELSKINLLEKKLIWEGTACD